MKNKYITVLLFLSVLLCYGSSCKKQPDALPQAEIDKLPAATQTGANTFGCLVNGQAFLPHSSSFLTGSYQCNYIYTNGGYYLTVKASNDSNNDYNVALVLGTTMLDIHEGQTLKLEGYNVIGKAFGSYGIITGSVLSYETSSFVTGQLYISKFDQIKQIVSGTFSFNAVNASKPDTIHITDGRFDMKYTQ